jgi:hypothetical protein
MSNKRIIGHQRKPWLRIWFWGVGIFMGWVTASWD